MKTTQKIKFACLTLLMLVSVACNKDSKDETRPVDEINYVDTNTGQTTTVGSNGSGGGQGGTTGGSGVEIPGNQTWNEEFMDLINEHRTSLGLRALVSDEGMNAMALGHSKDMATGVMPFGHDGFSNRCAEAREVLGSGNQCGENVAMGQKTPQAVFTAWMNSSGHRVNIEGARYTHSGFGYVKSASGAYYWTHLFMEEI